MFDIDTTLPNEEAAEQPVSKPTEGSEGMLPGWFAFHEKMVQLQLREPYIGVSYSRTADGSYSPSMTKEGAVRASPVLSGILFIESSGTPSGLLLLLKSQIADNSGDFALISLHPEDVLNCTHIHQSRIVSPA